MLFLFNSRIRPGVKRDQVVEYLKRCINPQEWDLVKKGVVAHWLFKVGDQPGILVVVNCDSIEQARTLADTAPMARAGLVEFDVEPVDHFPHFE